MSGPETDLQNTLNSRADEFARLGGSDLDLDQVLSRAGEIRRGRRMRASMVMAAVVLAIAVPVGIVALDNGPDGVTPAPQPTNTPTLVEPNHDPISLNGLEPGDLPLDGFAFAGALHYATDRIPLGKGGEVRALARISGGFLVARNDGQSRVTFVADDGSSPDVSWPIGDGGFAVSPDGTVGAFVEPNGTVVAVQDAGARYFDLGRLSAPGTPSWSVAAVTGENCAGRSEQTGCTVYVNDLSARTGVYSITDHGKITALQRSITHLADATGDLLTGITSVSDSGSCSAVTTMDDTSLWSTCKYQLQAFSPDGAHVLGVQAYGDGLGDNELAVLDASDGTEVLDLKVAEGVTLYSLAWENNGSVLAIAGQGNKYELIRFRLDGNRQLVLEPMTGVDDTAPPLQIPVG